MFSEEIDSSVATTRRVSRTNWLLAWLGLALILAAILVIESDYVLSGTGTAEHSRDQPVFAPRSGVVVEILAVEGDLLEAGSPVLRLIDPQQEARRLGLEREKVVLENLLESARLRLEAQAIQPVDAPLLAARERLERLQAIEEANDSVYEAVKNLDKEGRASKLELRRERVAQLQNEMLAIEAAIQANWLENGLPEIKIRQVEAVIAGTLAEIQALERELAWLARESKFGLVTAPIAGRLAALSYKYTGMAAKEGDFLFRIIDESSPMEVEAHFGQRDIDMVRVGMKARLRSAVSDSMLGGNIRGQVAKVALLPDETGPNGPLYEIELTVDENTALLVPGSDVEVEILLGQRDLWEVMRDSLSGTNARQRMNSTEDAAKTAPAAP